MIIAISGLSGCGNTSTSKILAERLGLELINFTFRNLAEEKGLDFLEIHKKALEDDSFDRELDERQKALARESGKCILSSRLAVWLLRDVADFKVYLDFPLDVRAERIYNREGGSLEEKREETRERDSENERRYKRIYGIDMRDFPSFCDLTIKDYNLSAKEVAEEIYRALGEKKII